MIEYLCVCVSARAIAIYRSTSTLNQKATGAVPVIAAAPLIALSTPCPCPTSKPNALNAFNEQAVHSVYVRRWFKLPRDNLIDFPILALSTLAPQSNEPKLRTTDDNAEIFSVFSYNILSDMTVNHSMASFMSIPPHLRCSLLLSALYSYT